MTINAATADAAEAAAAAAAARPASQGKRGGSGRGTRNPTTYAPPRLAAAPRLSGLCLLLTHREVPEGSSSEALLAAAGVCVCVCVCVCVEGGGLVPLVPGAAPPSLASFTKSK